MIFYLALNLLKKEKNGLLSTDCLKEYKREDTWEKLTSAVKKLTWNPLDTFDERNEWFLDLAENYRKEGLYRDYLEPAAEEAERYLEGYKEEGLLQNLERFGVERTAYELLFRNLLTEEIYADTLLPDGSFLDMVVKLQWIAMEYAVIVHCLFLTWSMRGSLNYETVRDYITLIVRMTGYDEEDIREYLENSFESLVWEWGYFVLVTGNAGGFSYVKAKEKKNL